MRTVGGVGEVPDEHQDRPNRSHTPTATAAAITSGLAPPTTGVSPTYMSWETPRAAGLWVTIFTCSVFLFWSRQVTTELAESEARTRPGVHDEADRWDDQVTRPLDIIEGGKVRHAAG